LLFLNSCQTYFGLCPEGFLNEQVKIVWAMSYMKVGRAAKWTAQIFQWEQQSENVVSSKYLDWDDFRDEFKREFTPAHPDAVSINRLESATHYQKTQSLDDYLDEFRDLITESGYTDPKTIVVKFQRGLNTQIQNSVSTMTSGMPSGTSTTQWYEMACTRTGPPMNPSNQPTMDWPLPHPGYSPLSHPPGPAAHAPTTCTSGANSSEFDPNGYQCCQEKDHTICTVLLLWEEWALCERLP
jgi:hypothetical protein